MGLPSETLYSQWSKWQIALIYWCRECPACYRKGKTSVRETARRRISGEAFARSTPHVVILVHGIRDHALWQHEVGRLLTAEGFVVQPTNYGRFDLLRFLLPANYFRDNAIERVRRQIQLVEKKYRDHPISIIAHSFGTYIVSSILQNEVIKLERVIFCGSVVSYDFPFQQFDSRFEVPILNEVGTRDVWPALAESGTWGYGSAGTYGFHRPVVTIDRWHRDAKHGYFLNEDFCQKYWVPFLRDGTIIAGDPKPPEPAFWVRLLSVARLRYLIPTLVVLASLGWYFLPSAEIVIEGDKAELITLPNRPHGGPVRATVDTIVPDWKGREEQRKAWQLEGRSLIPGLRLFICTEGEVDCWTDPNKSRQVGSGEGFERVLPAGPAKVQILNFRGNPPVKVRVTVTEP